MQQRSSVFRLGKTSLHLQPAINSEMFVYDGITFSHRNGKKEHWTDTILDAKYAKDILKLVLAQDYKKLNAYLQKIKGFRAGLDCWCDQCDKTYCTKEYKRKDEWSDDDTLERVMGTCPKGHEKELFVQD